MLTPEDFNKIEKQAITLYQSLELEIIQEIAERIANVGYINDVIIAQEIRNVISRYCKKSISI